MPWECRGHLRGGRAAARRLKGVDGDRHAGVRRRAFRAEGTASVTVGTAASLTSEGREARTEQGRGRW